MDLHMFSGAVNEGVGPIAINPKHVVAVLPVIEDPGKCRVLFTTGGFVELHEPFAIVISTLASDAR